MDTTTLPANWAALLVILANPVTFGIVISIIFEQIPLIKNPLVANWKKITALLGACLGWAFGVTALQGTLTLTRDGIYSVVILGIGVAMATQLWHTLVIQGMPALANILKALFGGTVTATVTSMTQGGTATFGQAAGTTSSAVSTTLTATATPDLSISGGVLRDG